MKKPWLKNYPQGVPTTISIPPTKGIPEFFFDTVKTYPHRTALFYFGRNITYTELETLVDTCVHWLKDLGVKPGDRVALHLPNVPQFVISYLAILKYGAIAVPINPTYTGQDLEHIVRESGSRLAITLSKFLPSLLEIKDKTGLKYVVVANVKDYLPQPARLLFTLFREGRDGHRVKNWSKNVLNFKTLMKSKPLPLPYYPRNKDRAIALIQYTGGTTGRPKGVVLTHRNLAANALQIRSWLPDFKDGEEVVAAVLPFFHIYALSAILNVGILSGATIILFPEPNLDLILKAIKSHQITVLPGVPLLYERILKHRLKKNTASLKFSVSGAAPLKAETQRDFEALSSSTLVEGYGLTETSGATHVNPLGGKRKIGSIGIPIPSTDAKILDLETGRELGPNEIGELVVYGPQIMRGYWNDQAATEAVLKKGWLLTGDIATYDNEGYFFIVDRKKDMIQLKGSGLKVYPSEVEEVIIQLPFVEEVVVARQKDDNGDEIPVAYVVLKKDTGSSKDWVQEIKKHCIKHLAAYKVPRDIEFVTEIPKTIIGKPLRRKLRDEP